MTFSTCLLHSEVTSFLSAGGNSYFSLLVPFKTLFPDSGVPCSGDLTSSDPAPQPCPCDDGGLALSHPFHLKLISSLTGSSYGSLAFKSFSLKYNHHKVPRALTQEQRGAAHHWAGATCASGDLEGREGLNSTAAPWLSDKRLKSS